MSTRPQTVNYCLSQSVVAHRGRTGISIRPGPKQERRRTVGKTISPSEGGEWVNMININQNRRNQINCEYCCSTLFLLFLDERIPFTISWFLPLHGPKLSRPSIQRQIWHLFDLFVKINSINGLCGFLYRLCVAGCNGWMVGGWGAAGSNGRLHKRRRCIVWSWSWMDGVGRGHGPDAKIINYPWTIFTLEESSWATTIKSINFIGFAVTQDHKSRARGH